MTAALRVSSADRWRAIGHASTRFHRGFGASIEAAPEPIPNSVAPAPTPLVLKPEYDKPYQARRAEEAAAAKRGEQLANTSAECIPYGMPTMMAVAIYPVEFIQTPKQVTIVSEAFSEVRRVYLDRPQLKLEDVPPGYVRPLGWPLGGRHTGGGYGRNQADGARLSRKCRIARRCA